MDHVYVILPSDSSGFYFPDNTIVHYRSKLATSIELKLNKWEFVLVEISYPKGYKKRFQHNTIRLDSQEVIFVVKHYESLFDLLPNISHLLEPSKKERFMQIFKEYTNKYQELGKQLFNSCYGENSIRICENVKSHFPARVYNGLEDFAETIMKATNCRTPKITVSVKDKTDFTTPEPLHVYTYIIKTNLFGNFYVRLLTTLHSSFEYRMS